MRSRILTAVTASLLLACASRAPTAPVGSVGPVVPAGSNSFDTLAPPAVFVTHDVGDNCNGTIAVDADGGVWEESGCEERSSGVNRTRHLSEEQRTRLRSALDVLRHASDSPMGSCGRFETLFMLREADGSRRQWYVCPPQEGTPWPAPFADVVAALR